MIIRTQLRTKEQLSGIKIFVVLGKPDQQVDWLFQGIKQNQNDFVITVKDEITRKKTSSFEKYQEQFSIYPAKDNATAAVVTLIGRAESELVSIDRSWLTEQKDISFKQNLQMILLSNDTSSGR